MSAGPRQRRGVVAREIAGETLLVPVRHRAQEMGLFTLNEVGTFLWSRLDGTRSPDALVREVLARFDVDEARVRVDLGEFLGQLREAGCLEEARP